jgi:hypothetical protein
LRYLFALEAAASILVLRHGLVISDPLGTHRVRRRKLSPRQRQPANDVADIRNQPLISGLAGE